MHIWAVTLLEVDEDSSCVGKLFLLLNPSGFWCSTNKTEGWDKSNFVFVFFPAPCRLFYSRLPRVGTQSPVVRETKWKNPGASRNMISKWLSAAMTLSSAQFIQMKRSSNVPYQLTAFNQTVSTPSIIHPVCDSRLARSFLFLFFFFRDINVVVLSRGPGSCCRPDHYHCSVQLTCLKSIVPSHDPAQQITMRGENIYKYVHA